MTDQLTRRHFLASTTLATAAAVAVGAAKPQADGKAKPATTQYTGPRLSIAIIGTGGRGNDHVREINEIPSANIVALCDCDSAILEREAKKVEAAKTFIDFRDVLKLPNLDAVVIATPDHTHGVIAAAAMRAGKHVYCEKPLCHTVAETRAVVKLAEETGVITQTGIQIHSKDNYRRVVELIQAGAIGPVGEVHIWNNRFQRQYSTEPCDPPKTLNYDLWLGPVPHRPFQRAFHPYSWREFWHFASGLLGDVGSHFFDVVFWALDLKYPTRIEAIGGPRSDDLCSVWNQATYDFPARGDQPAVRMMWYDPPTKPEALASWKLPEKWNDEGILFVGKKGMLYTNYGEHRLLPEEKFKDFKKPTTRLASSPGHQAEWINACLAKDPKLATTPFSYGALLTETALLGAVAFRAGKALDYDAANMKFPKEPEAEKFLSTRFREGWTI